MHNVNHHVACTSGPSAIPFGKRWSDCAMRHFASLVAFCLSASELGAQNGASAFDTAVIRSAIELGTHAKHTSDVVQIPDQSDRNRSDGNVGRGHRSHGA